MRIFIKTLTIRTVTLEVESTIPRTWARLVVDAVRYFGVGLGFLVYNVACGVQFSCNFNCADERG